MEALHSLVNIILHLDQNLVTFISLYGVWIYALLFLIIFCETGLVITPFLPGDSLLFATGVMAAKSANNFNIHLLFILLVVASITGNALNYLIGRFLGPRIFSSEYTWLLSKNHLAKTHAFYEKYGARTIIIARFIPIIRTIAPFAAGLGYMSYGRFAAYNVIGALFWVGGLLYVSYLFGNIP